jgi:hypothetical protein
MEKVSNEMFVLRIDFAAFYQQQYRSAMRQYKTASAAAAAVSRHQDELVDVNDGCKVDGAGGTSTSNRRLSWWDHIVSSYNVVQLPVLTGIRGWVGGCLGVSPGCWGGWVGAQMGFSGAFMQVCRLKN